MHGLVLLAKPDPSRSGTHVGMLATTRVPASHVFAAPYSGPAAPEEHEMVVLGHGGVANIRQESGVIKAGAK